MNKWRGVHALLPTEAQEYRLASMSLVDSIGTGLFVATIPVFLIRHQQVDATTVGQLLSAGGLALLVTAIPAGFLADQLPLRSLYAAGSLVQAAASMVLATVPPVVGVGIALVAANVGAGIVAPPRAVMVARAAPPDALTRVRAYNRAVFQVGMSLGAGAAAVVIWLDRTELYAVGFVVNALTFLINSLLSRYIVLGGDDRAAAKRVRPPRTLGAERWAAYRDVPFLLAAAVNAVLVVTAVLADPVLAVFVSAQVRLPTVLVPFLLVLNTVLSVVLQVPLSRRCIGSVGVRAAQRRAGLGALVGCAFIALSTIVGASAAIVVALALGMVALTIAELLVSAASWEASFRLAPHHLQGQYFSTFNLGPGLAMAVGPALITPLVLVSHGVGWLLVGLILCSVGVIGASVTSSAIAQRVPLKPVPVP